MTPRYRLPCPNCARSLTVTPPQAGETLPCACGTPVVVPTLRELRRLAPLETDPSEAISAPGWTLLRGSLFVLGMILLAAAILASVQVYRQRQKLDTAQPAFRELDFDIQQLTPTQAWQFWDYYRQRDLQIRVTPRYLENRAKYQQFNRYLIAGATAAGLGVVLIIVSLVGKSL